MLRHDNENALKELQMALKLDPTNTSAKDLMTLIEKKRPL
jgi:Tfp pilus assembly protein PilF